MIAIDMKIYREITFKFINQRFSLEISICLNAIDRVLVIVRISMKIPKTKSQKKYLNTKNILYSLKKYGYKIGKFMMKVEFLS